MERGAFAAPLESGNGPTLTTWALQQVVSYLGYTGRAADVVARAALAVALSNLWNVRPTARNDLLR